MKVRKMREADFEEVYDTFLAGTNLHDSQADYRPLFSTQWAKHTEACGFVMEDTGCIVGILGTLFSDRLIGGQRERFCNLHTWFVKEEHRGHSLALMRPVTRLRNCTITDLSPSPAVVQISRRLGFQILDSQLTLLLPVRFRSQTQVAFSSPDDHCHLLSEADQQILTDHADLPCERLLVTTPTGKSCLIVYRIIPQRFRYCYLHYVSDLELFQEHSIAIRRELSSRSGCRFVAVNRRSLGSKRIPKSYTLPVGIPQLYKSQTVNPSKIDTLYSEVLINNWPLVPTFRAGLRALAEARGLIQENESLKQRIGRLFRPRKSIPRPVKAASQP